MELCFQVLALADHLSQLDSEELSTAELKGLDAGDVQRQLSRHLVDQFWCSVLRRSPHSPATHSWRQKNSRYSASSILEDLELSARKRVVRAAPHVGSAFEESREGPSSRASTRQSVSSNTKYQCKNVYVDVALHLHREALRRKGLHLELLAMDTLLQLLESVSHVERWPAKRIRLSQDPSRWTHLTCRTEVLEMFCHLSSEPEPCMEALELGRHALVRKGVREVRQIDTKLMLGNLNSRGFGVDESFKWTSSYSAPSFRKPTKPIPSDRWTSEAFDNALSRLPNLDAATGSSVSVATGLDKLTINSSLGSGETKLPINSAWLPVATSTDMESIKDFNVTIIPPPLPTKDAYIEKLDNKVTSNWVSSSVKRTYEAPFVDNVFVPDPSGSEQKKTAQASRVPEHTVRFFENSLDALQSELSRVNVFCHVDPKSRTPLHKYAPWQTLPSFDYLALKGNMGRFGGSAVNRESIEEAMVGFTVRRLNGAVHKGPDKNANECDWFSSLVTGLQGLESDLFASETRCAYDADPSSVPIPLHKWVADVVGNGQWSPKALCEGIVGDFLAQLKGKVVPELVEASSDRLLVKLPLAIAPWQGSELAALMRLQCTPFLKALPGYSSLKFVLSELAEIGSTIRNLKYFVALIRCLENIGSGRAALGTVISVYASALDSFLCEFEGAASRFFETDISGSLCETISVYSVYFGRLQPWMGALRWLSDVSFTSGEAGVDGKHFVLPRGSWLLEHLVSKYLGSFGNTEGTDSIAHRSVYRCVITTLKPYLGFIRRWVTGWRGEDEPCDEFQHDGHLRVISPLVAMEGIIQSSRELCVFIECHYYAHLPAADSVFSRYLIGDDTPSGIISATSGENTDTTIPFSDLIRDINDDLLANHHWLNLETLNLLKSDYRIFDILKDIDGFVFFSRFDLMEGVFDEWSRGKDSDSYATFFQSPLRVRVSVESATEFRRAGATLEFSAGLFDSYIFTEDVVECYNSIFRQLCTVHLGSNNVLRVIRWLCLNFRGSCNIGTRRCAPILRVLCLLTRDMHAMMSSLEWYLRYAALAPSYADFMRTADGITGFTDFVSNHKAFVRRARNACLMSPDSVRYSALIRALCYCCGILHESVLGLGFDVLRTVEHADALMALELPCRELAAKFDRLKREFFCLVNSSHDPALFQLGTILQATTNYTV
ncbi:microsomal signal peptidase subunit gp23, putative [Babesia ovata]|uniref:Microsomal signal peptidase subunit gp23, putative n=1 Tax=Babesia ovata TaxID=189622 RepID=A0A2H6KDI5_9APIC|nr:microsomal signal peptidase subunit gp23, putative [Babesia ovata]GBE61051.1 microsomal signal peptidase subunit gp23, putative [Babesia ovata]